MPIGKYVTAAENWSTRNLIGDKFDVTIGSLIIIVAILLDIFMNTLVKNFHCKKFILDFRIILWLNLFALVVVLICSYCILGRLRDNT